LLPNLKKHIAAKASCVILLLTLATADQLHGQINYTSTNDISIIEDDQVLEHPFTGGFNAPRPQFWDIDQDGDQDLFIQRDQNSILFFEGHLENENTRFEYIPKRFSEIDPGFWFRLIDLDSSGIPSLFIGRELNSIEHHLWNPSSESFEVKTRTLLQGSGTALSFDPGSVPEFADIDCDGDKDLFLPISDGTLVHYTNTGLDNAGSPIRFLR